MGSGKSKVLTSMQHCTLWKADRNPGCRAVMMALDALNLNINEVDVDMDKGEQRSEELMMMNHRGTLPILRDRELILCDSHAIASYLASRYCSEGRLLPKDAGGRALVDQLMHYNSAVLMSTYNFAANPILYEGYQMIPQHTACMIKTAYADLECMFGDQPFLGGNKPNLGDICIAATVSTLDVMVPVDQKFPKMSSWLYRMSEEPFYLTANKQGLAQFTRRIGELSTLHIES